MAIIDLLYSPFLGFLRNPPSRSEKQVLINRIIINKYNIK